MVQADATDRPVDSLGGMDIQNETNHFFEQKFRNKIELRGFTIMIK